MASQSSALALERFTSFGDLLKFLRRRAGLTQRELSIAVGYSHAQISRLELNQRPPDLATVVARFVPALDLEDEPAVAARLVELASALPPDESPAPGEAPFMGLHFFDEADAGRFFGREALTARLLERVEAAQAASTPLRFLAVVGASGSGKSSVVRAGLIPAMRRSQVFAGWPIRCLTPTARPLQALAMALMPEPASVAATASLMDDLAHDRRALHLAAARLAGPAARGVALVIDQLEELFTLCQDEAERRAFIDNLMTAATEPGGSTCVVLALRADFYANCAPYAALRDALVDQQVYIGPMSSEELRRAIEEPARRDRWELEPGLVDLLLQDVGADVETDYAPEPGALPLLSHALLETWGRRRGRTLTVSGYLASGGVSGAIAETADAVYHDQFDPPRQAIARNIFLRLTQLGEAEAAPETRRRAPFEELMRRPDDAPLVRDVLTSLADARLITTDNEVAEVAHEALIREWRTLRGWLEEDRESLRLHRHLTLASEGWERHSRDPGELYRGSRLVQALNWAVEHSGDLSGSEQAFLDASQALAGREAAEREAQRQRELEAARTLAETQRRAAAQLRRRALYLSGAFILALGLAGVALFLGEQARQSAVAAQTQERIAFGRELSAAAISNLNVDAERSLLLALQAISTTRTVDGSVLPEAEEALHRSLLGSQVRLALTGHQAWVLGVAYSPDGKRIASVERDGTAIIWDAASGAELLRLPGATEVGDAWGAQRIAFSPDGLRLAIGDANLVRVYDPATGNLIASLAGHTADVWAVAYSPDGRLLVSAGPDAIVRLWDAESGALVRELTGHTDAVESAVFSPDSRWLATNADDGTLKIWDTATGRLVDDVQDISSAGFSPDGARLATTGLAGLQVWQVASDPAAGSFTSGPPLLTIQENAIGPVFTPDGTAIAAISGSTVKVWDAATGRELFNLAGHTNWVTSFALSPDGQRLASASFDETVRVWSLAPGQEAVTVRGTGWRVIYSPDGKLLATDGQEGTARLWDASTGELRLALPAHTEKIWAVAFSPDGQRLATASSDQTAKVWDISTGQVLATMTGHELDVRDVAFSPDGTRIATASFDQTARVWDVATGHELLKLTGHTGLVLGIAYSPDGTRIATSSADRTGKVWDADTGQLLLTLTGHTEPGPDVAFSPDGSLIATSSQDATAILWNAATGERRFTLAGHTAEIQSVAFSPDGKLLATGSGDNTAKIWDVATGQELHTLYGSQGGVYGVAFSPDGAHLAVASTDGVVRVYLLKMEDLLALAGSRVTRSLSLEECQKYLHMAACP